VRREGERAQTGWETNNLDAREPLQQIGSHSFTAKPGATDKAIGTYVYTSRALRAGRCALRFVYVYPGGPYGVPRTATLLVRECIITVIVTAADAEGGARRAGDGKDRKDRKDNGGRGVRSWRRSPTGACSDGCALQSVEGMLVCAWRSSSWRRRGASSARYSETSAA
jgi:hypothetical protein